MESFVTYVISHLLFDLIIKHLLFLNLRMYIWLKRKVIAFNTGMVHIQMGCRNSVFFLLFLLISTHGIIEHCLHDWVAMLDDSFIIFGFDVLAVK